MAVDPDDRYLLVRFEGSVDGTDRLITAIDKFEGGLVTIQQLRLLGRPDGHQQVETFLQMLKHHRSLVHPNIAALLNVFLSPDQTYLCIVMEHTDAGTLQDHLSGFRHLVSDREHVLSENHARRFFQQLMLALDYMQHKAIAHRELRQSSLLLKVDPADKKSLQLKLFSFRHIKNYFDRRATNSVVSRDQYAPPEMLSGSSHWGPEVDMWCAGTLLFHMLTGEYPFEQEPSRTLEELADALRRRQDGTWQHGLPAHISEHCRDLLAGLLQFDPSRRFGLVQVKQNPWFQRGWARGDQLTVTNQREFAAAQDRDAMQQAFKKNLEYLSMERHPPPCELDAERLRVLTKQAIQLLLRGS